MFKFQNLLAACVLCAAPAFAQSAFDDVIIRVAKPYDKTIAGIEAQGGKVTHQFKYVDAIAAQVPHTATGGMRASPGVIAMRKDSKVRRAQIANQLETQLGGGASQQLRADGVSVLAAADFRTLSSGSTQASFSVNNTLMGMGSLFQAGKHGEGVLVAVIDSGIRPGFPHIEGSVIGGEDLVGDGRGYSELANDGHGTFVSGMIAAHAGFLFPNDSLMVKALNAYAPGSAKPFDAAKSLVPMVGTAPYASLYMLRTTDGPTPDSRIMQAMERVIELRERYDAGLPGGLNIKVCNMSLGGPTLDPGFDAEDQLIDAMLAHDIVPVIAAGNSGPASITLGTPATSRSALAVGGASLAHNERVAAELNLGPGMGALYRPFAGPLMYFASSRGPDARGRIEPHVLAGAHFNFSMGEGETDTFTFASGTSGAAPSVAGIAAVLRQTYPDASARQIRNAIILSANPNFVNSANLLDQGHGFVDATAASHMLAAGSAPDTLEPLPDASPSVQVNVEQNTSVKVVEGFVHQTFHLKPGERSEIVYRVPANTSQVIVSLTNFVGGPMAQQNQLAGDTLTFGIHSAKTSDYAGEGNYVSPLEHLQTGTRTVDNPEPGLMRIVVNGSWRNAGDVSVEVSVVSLQTEPVPHFTVRGEIASAQTAMVPFTVPPGTKLANFRLAWKPDWGHTPTADIDLFLVSPSQKVNSDGATENNPESFSIPDPEPGTWVAMIKGFDIPQGGDKFDFRIELDGKIIH